MVIVIDCILPTPLLFSHRSVPPFPSNHPRFQAHSSSSTIILNLLPKKLTVASSTDRFTFVLPVISTPRTLIWYVHVTIAVWLTFNVFWNYVRTILTPAGSVPEDFVDNRADKDPEAQVSIYCKPLPHTNYGGLASE